MAKLMLTLSDLGTAQLLLCWELSNAGPSQTCALTWLVTDFPRCPVHKTTSAAPPRDLTHVM